MIYATRHKKPRSAAEDKRNFEKHLPWLASRLSTIKKSDVQALHSKHRQQTAASTRRTARWPCSAPCSTRRMKSATRGPNPAKGVKMFKEESRDRFLQPGELEAFFRALQAEAEVFRDFFLMSLLTGARQGNVLSNEVGRPGPERRVLADTRNQSRDSGYRAACRPGPSEFSRPARKRATALARGSFPGHRKGDHLHYPRKAPGNAILNNAKLTESPAA